MKRTHLTLALLALASSPVLAALPYSEAFVYDGSSDVELIVKANDTRVVGTTESTKVNIKSITVDEDYVAQNGNNGAVFFTRGEFTNSGTLYAHMIYLTTRTSYFEGSSEVKVSGATSFVNNGTIVTEHEEFGGIDSYNIIEVRNGAVLTNKGTITGYVSVLGEGSKVIAENGSVFNYRVDIGGGTSAGIFQVNGAITMNADLWAESGEIVFTEGASIDMKGNSIYDLDNISLVYAVEGNVNELTPIKTSDLFLNANIADDTVITVQGSDGSSYETTLGNLTIPEPTTATMSLLALAALATRRRRK